MNTMLLHRFTEIEVVSSMKQMAPLKALGLDGMPPVFYQSYWHVVGLDVIQAVLDCLNMGKLLPSLNHTFVTLIPKMKNLERESLTTDQLAYAMSFTNSSPKC